jgi:signal peptidase II
MMTILVIFALVVALDQVSKAIVASRLPEGRPTRRAIYGVGLRRVVNRDHPWSSKSALRVMAILWLAGLTVAIAIARVLDTPGVHVALGAGLGGAIGNLLDGFRRRAVTDFVDLRVWPVFNVADAAIVTGALLIAGQVLGLM